MQNDKQFVSGYLAESLAVMTTFATDPTFAEELRSIGATITYALRNR